jgi:hypothetical protein
MHNNQAGSELFAEQGVAMTIRSRRETITFQHPFRIKGIDRSLPAGDYEVITDEEMIEGLSFAAYRRIATMIVVPVRRRARSGRHPSSRPGRSRTCGLRPALQR